VAISNKESAEIESARGQVYAFFAALFLNQPSPESLGEILSDQVVSALEGLFPQQRATTAKLRKAVADYGRGACQAEDFVLDYDGMLRVPGDAYIHPFESVYRDKNPSSGDAKGAMVFGSLTREVAKVYLSEGLGLKDGFVEPPDHLGVELEFMAFLCRKTAEALKKADQRGVATFRSKQQDFLNDHLLPWSGDCLAKMEENASTPIYRCFASLLRSFLENEKSYSLEN